MLTISVAEGCLKFQLRKQKYLRNILIVKHSNRSSNFICLQRPQHFEHKPFFQIAVIDFQVDLKTKRLNRSYSTHRSIHVYDKILYLHY